MIIVFNLCKQLIKIGKLDGLQEKMDMFLANDRLTVEEYQELVNLLAA